MREPLPVTDEDVRAAWDAIYTTAHQQPLAPNLKDWLDVHTLTQLRSVLENDRKRVIERESQEGK